LGVFALSGQGWELSENVINDCLFCRWLSYYVDGKTQRKLWTEQSMEAATKGVLTDNMMIREASRLYNVPFETL